MALRAQLDRATGEPERMFQLVWTAARDLEAVHKYWHSVDPSDGNYWQHNGHCYEMPVDATLALREALAFVGKKA